MQVQPNNAYAQKLVVAEDLEAEKARAERMKAEAEAEMARNRKKAEELKAVAERRLAAIAREMQLRAKAANGGLPPALEKSRAADAVAARARIQETSRLVEVKQDYAKGLEGKSPKQLRAEQKSEHERLDDAQNGVSIAREHLAEAKTPAQRAAASQVLASAERSLRTEYAKRAAIDNVAPVSLNHKELHDFANTLKTKSVEQLQAERSKVDADRTGAIRGTRAEREMDKVKLAIIDQALAKVGAVNAVDKTRNPGNVVFDGSGSLLADISSTDPAALAAKLKAAGQTWVSVQINNHGPREDNIAALPKFKEEMEKAGIKVGFWGVSYTDTENDAREAAQLTAKYGGAFYIADCELHFQYDKSLGDDENNLRVGRNRTFVEAFQDEATKQGIGDIPRALTGMGRTAMDMKPWIDNGYDAIPQAYWNSYEHYQPSLCVDYYTKEANVPWPKDRVHPLIATYDGSSEGGARPKSIAEYMADLQKSGTKGYSFYLECNDEQARELGGYDVNGKPNG